MIKLFGSVFQSSPGNPIPNSYWVEPGRLLAGEYPGITRPESAGRVQTLLDAGITSFIDLTAEGELPPYNVDLGNRARHRRFAITDHELPSSPEFFDDVIAAIDADLSEGRRIYLHCRAGIGRTGMAVGCYLIHRGLDGKAAFDRLQELWQRCARSRSWPSVPETEEQIRYLMSWQSSRSRTPDATARIEGALFGLAVGEALGHLTAEQRLADGSWIADAKRVEQLQSGADTGMTLAAAESLLAKGSADADDQMARYVAVSQRPGMQLRMPAELKRVLAAWQWSRKRNPGSHDPKNLDAHPLARTLAAALFAKGDAFKAAELATELARTTLQSPLVLDAARVWSATLVQVLSGATKSQVSTMTTARDAMHGRVVKAPIAALLAGDSTRTQPLDGAINIVAQALAAFKTTQSFEAAVRQGAKTSPSCAALVGTIAGACYGVRAIPAEWVAALPEADTLRALARRFGA
jgi:ADP-ribosylglycohydrolase